MAKHRGEPGEPGRPMEGESFYSYSLRNLMNQKRISLEAAYLEFRAQMEATDPTMDKDRDAHIREVDAAYKYLKAKGPKLHL